MFCGAKYTHHTFTPIIKHFITTANIHPRKKSFIDKNMKNPTGIKLCISHKIATSWGHIQEKKKSTMEGEEGEALHRKKEREEGKKEREYFK